MKEALSIFPNLPYTLYLVRKLQDIEPEKQIGKTIIQKMLFLFSREANIGFDYSLYHYGPFCSEVASDIEIAEKLNLLDIEWNPDSGYKIGTRLKEDDINDFIKEEERKKLDSVVTNFVNYNATELSLIATAVYIRDNFETEDENLAESVNAIKPRYDLTRIKSVLRDAKIL